MLSNQDVVQCFYDGKAGHNRSLRSTGDKLFSYQTVILQRIRGILVGNTTKYSRTTSKHQTLAKVHHADSTVQHIKGAQDLSQYV